MSDGVCSFKKVCKECRLVDISDRPVGCIDLQCEHYTPCKKCKNNLTLKKNGICRSCLTGESIESEVPVRDEYGNIDIVKSYEADDIVEGEEIEDYDMDETIKKELERIELEKKYKDKKTRKVYASHPGTPPSNFSDQSKAYYKKKWNDYIDHWGNDPTCHTSIHLLILMEHDLIILTQKILLASQEEKVILEKHRKVLLSNKSSIMKDMPEAEARKDRKEQASLAAIYETYCKEVGATKIGDLRRMFSPEAVVLAPILPYKVNLNELLRMLNLSTQEQIELERIVCNVGEMSSVEIINFIGFPINQTNAEVPSFYEEQ